MGEDSNRQSAHPISDLFSLPPRDTAVGVRVRNTNERHALGTGIGLDNPPYRVRMSKMVQDKRGERSAHLLRDFRLSHRRLPDKKFSGRWLDANLPLVVLPVMP